MTSSSVSMRGRYCAAGVPRVRGPKAMLSSTVYHGNRAASWNTTARPGWGACTGSPSTSTCPRVGRSKPATMFSNVDLPQPLGPRMAANSLCATARSIDYTATTWRPRAANSLATPRSSTAGAIGSAVRPEGAPAQRHPRGAQDHPVGEKAEQPHREHRGHTDVHPSHVVGVPQHVAEAGLHRDHLGHDHRRPRHADPEAQAGED